MCDAIDSLEAFVTSQVGLLRGGDIDTYLLDGDLLTLAWRSIEASGLATPVNLPRIEQLQVSLAELADLAAARMAEISARLVTLGRARAAHSAYLTAPSRPSTGRREA